MNAPARKSRRRPSTVPVRKVRTRGHIIAELSANHVERRVLECGFAVEQTRHDYGIDMILFFYDDAGEVRDGQVLFQLKATDTVKWLKGKRQIAFVLDRRDLATWLRSPQPVILVVYDAAKDRAYWLYVQAYLAAKKAFNLSATKATMTVHLPVENIVDAAAIRRFAVFSENVVRQQFGRIKHHE